MKLKFKSLQKNLLVKKLKGINRRTLIVASVAAALAVLGYMGRSLVVAAVVNGQPITRLKLISELEKQGGSQTLDNLVVKSLIFQEARLKRVEVSQEEIDLELTRIESIVKEQGMSLDEALSLQNQSRSDLIEQIRIQKTVEKVLADKITVTDEEIKDYFEKNQDLYDKGAKLEDVSGNIKSQLAQTKLSSAYQTWITDLKANASINYFVNF